MGVPLNKGPLDQTPILKLRNEKKHWGTYLKLYCTSFFRYDALPYDKKFLREEAFHRLWSLRSKILN